MLLLLSIAGLVFAFVKVLNKDDPPQATDIEVPNVIDKTEAEARRVISDMGFASPQTVEVTKDDKTPGTVFDQSPAAGKMVKPTTTIILQISLGAGSEFPPNVVGLSADEAEKSLKDRGFGVQRASQTSIDVPEGIVISQDPTPDRLLQKGKPVLIRISTGGQEITMPDVTNQPIDQVLKRLTDLKLRVAQLREASETIDTDRVIRTDPVANAKTKEGAVVNVVVSDGFPKVEMPNVVGLAQDVATAQLTAKGLTFTIDTKIDDSNVGKVITQSQVAGTQVRKNTNIRLTVGMATPTTTTTSTSTTTTSTSTTTRPTTTTK